MFFEIEVPLNWIAYLIWVVMEFILLNNEGYWT